MSLPDGPLSPLPRGTARTTAQLDAAANQLRVERARRYAADLRVMARDRLCSEPNLLNTIASNIEEALR